MTLPYNTPSALDEELEMGSRKLWTIFRGLERKVTFKELDDWKIVIASVNAPLDALEEKIIDALPIDKNTGLRHAICLEMASFSWDVSTIKAVLGDNWRELMRSGMEQ